MGTKSCIFGCIFAAECAQISQHTPILPHTKRLKNSRTEVDCWIRKPRPHRSPCSEQRFLSRIRYLSFGSARTVRAPVCTIPCTTPPNLTSRLHADPGTAPSSHDLQAETETTGSHSPGAHAPRQSKAGDRIQCPAIRSLRASVAPARKRPTRLHPAQRQFPAGNHRAPSLRPTDGSFIMHSHSQRFGMLYLFRFCSSCAPGRGVSVRPMRSG